MAQRIEGICYLKIDGEQAQLKGGIEAPFNKVKREAVMGVAGLVGFKESPVTAYIKVQVAALPAGMLDKLRNSTSLSVYAEFPDGSNYTLKGAFLAGDAVRKTEDSGIDVEFNGDSGEWGGGK